jgi:hypothetical protein
MDWFESLTGFRETSYDDTRSRLKVEDRRLHSLINGKSYGIGELELVPLQALRDMVKSAGGPPGRLKVSVVRGDVRKMHRSPENAGALFQVASQFNLLEMVGPAVTPEHGVTRYKDDPTQDPACAIAAGAAMSVSMPPDSDRFHCSRIAIPHPARFARHPPRCATLRGEGCSARRRNVSSMGWPGSARLWGPR